METLVVAGLELTTWLLSSAACAVFFVIRREFNVTNRRVEEYKKEVEKIKDTYISDKNMREHLKVIEDKINVSEKNILDKILMLSNLMGKRAK